MINKNRKILIYFVILILILSGSLYWLKKRSGINLFKSFSLSHTFPFKFIPQYVIKNPRPGDLIIQEEFEKKLWPLSVWGSLWMREAGKVIQGFDSAMDQSRCLLITSHSTRDWSFECQFLIRVEAGDVFYYEGSAMGQGTEAFAALGFTTFDRDQNVLEWNYGNTPVKPGPMVRIRNQVKIKEGIHFIRFRIAGVGRGQFRFDHIRLIKMSSDKPQ
jgi:hypothetical protein